MPLIDAGGVRFHTQLLGEGPFVVMLHGLFVGSLASWYFTAAPKLARSRRVFLYDLRGHGRSERTRAGYGIATMCADLQALLEAVDAPLKLDLVGHSYGGAIALRFALDNPGRVHRLVLVDTPLPAAEIDGLGDFALGPPEDLVEALPTEQQKALRRGGRRARKLLDNLRFLAEDTTLLDELRTEPDVGDSELRALDAPVLLAYGRNSPCRAAGERLSGELPRAELQLFDGGHYLPIECEAPLTAAIGAFLDG